MGRRMQRTAPAFGARITPAALCSHANSNTRLRNATGPGDRLLLNPALRRAILNRELWRQPVPKPVTAFCPRPIDDNLCSDPDILRVRIKPARVDSSDLGSLLTILLVACQLHIHSHDTCSEWPVACKEFNDISSESNTGCEPRGTPQLYWISLRSDRIAIPQTAFRLSARAAIRVSRKTNIQENL
ncbi:hypothetical protein GGE07_005962 [Sinorhizobium terangae]|nr:hypothetical protein [Sinorhizobium terangae]